MISEIHDRIRSAVQPFPRTSTSPPKMLRSGFTEHLLQAYIFAMPQLHQFCCVIREKAFKFRVIY